MGNCPGTENCHGNWH